MGKETGLTDEQIDQAHLIFLRINMMVAQGKRIKPTAFFMADDSDKFAEAVLVTGSDSLTVFDGSTAIRKMAQEFKPNMIIAVSEAWTLRKNDEGRYDDGGDLSKNPNRIDGVAFFLSTDDGTDIMGISTIDQDEDGLRSLSVPQWRDARSQPHNPLIGMAMRENWTQVHKESRKVELIDKEESDGS